MASNVPQCEPCAEDSAYLDATNWCSECQQWLCNNCSKYHKRLASTKTHTLLSSEEYQKLPNFASDIKRKCTQHPDNELEFYCNEHIAVLCFMCMKTKHSHCQSIKKLKDVACGVKTSAAVTDIISRMEDSISTFEKLEVDRNKNKDNISTTKKLCESKIKQLLDEHLKHINSLASSLQSDLARLYTDEMSALDEESNTYTLRKNNLEKKLADMKNMVQFAPDIQIFLSIEGLNKEITAQEEYLQSLEGMVMTKSLELDIDTNATRMNDLVKSYGRVNVMSSTCPIQLSGKNKAIVPSTLQRPQVAKETSKQISPSCSNFSKGSFALFRQFPVPRARGENKISKIRDMKCLSNGYLAMTDILNNRLLIIDQNGTAMLQEYLSGSPRCLTFTEDDRIALTLHEGKEVLVWNPYAPSKKEHINVEDNCTGIDCVGDTLVINCQKRGLLLYNLVNGTKRRITEYTGNFDLCSYGGGGLDICFYKAKSNDLVLINVHSGKEHWRMKVYSKQPSCLAKDESDNFYIVDSSNAIRKINTINKNTEIVLNESDGIREPQAVATFTEKRKRGVYLLNYRTVTKFFLFVVNNAGDSIFLFERK